MGDTQTAEWPRHHGSRFKSWMLFGGIVVMLLAGVLSVAPHLSAQPAKGLGPINGDPSAADKVRALTQVRARDLSSTVALSKSAPLLRSFATNGVRTVIVDRSEQEVTVFDANGAEIDMFVCSTGAYYPLPGTYAVFGRKKSSYSPDDGSRFSEFTMFASSHRNVSIGFHSVPIDRSGKTLGGLGKPVSHGCVRVEKSKASFLYGWAVNGTRVVVVR